MKLALVTSLVVVAATPVLAEADQLSAERLTAITVAFEMSSADPEMNTDRLSPARIALVQAAFATHDVAPEVERLDYAAWQTVQTAYTSHDPVYTEFAGLR